MANFTQYTYKVQVSTDNNFDELIINEWTTSVSSVFDSTELEYGTRYYWRVKRVNTMTGKESNWSNICTFVTKGQDIIIDVVPSTINFITYGLETVTECSCNHTVKIYTSTCPGSGVERYTSC